MIRNRSQFLDAIGRETMRKNQRWSRLTSTAMACHCCGIPRFPWFEACAELPRHGRATGSQSSNAHKIFRLRFWSQGAYLMRAGHEVWRRRAYVQPDSASAITSAMNP